jgi:hypothetical protein
VTENLAETRPNQLMVASPRGEKARVRRWDGESRGNAFKSINGGFVARQTTAMSPRGEKARAQFQQTENTLPLNISELVRRRGEESWVTGVQNKHTKHSAIK